MGDETLVYFGDAVKALDDSGKVGGYLVRFSDAEHKDLAGDYFTPKTYFGAGDGDGRDTLFHHGVPVKKGLEKLADHVFAPVKTKKDEVGIFAEVVLNLADKYEAKVHDLVMKGKLGWSSGSSSHLAKRAKDGELKRWIITEASLTPTPAEPQNRAFAVKSLAGVETELDEGLFEDASGEDKTAAKGLFEEQLAQVTPSAWELHRAFSSAMAKLATVAASTSVTNVEVDVAAKVKESVAEYAERLAPLVVAQINEYVEAGAQEDRFYLKGFTESPADSTFAEHLQSVLAAVESVNTRAKSIHDMRVKSGRMISTVNREKLSTLAKSLEGVRAEIEALLSASDSSAEKKDASEVLGLAAQFESLKMARLRPSAR